ncbi:hypothetical protein [Tumebacillus permanentifrigoris]|nr:hypothetical protein [Tumebacillus permanentifrigoris]
MAGARDIKSTLSPAEQARQRVLLAVTTRGLVGIHDEIEATLGTRKRLGELTKEEADRVFEDICKGRQREAPHEIS